MVFNHQKTPRLKPLLSDVPPGFLVDAAWLVARKIDRKSIHNYVKRGWLERVIRGLYRRPFLRSDNQTGDGGWALPVLSMQLMGYDVHVGGKTALAVHGYVHYLNLANEDTVYLYGDEVPPWLKRLPTDCSFETRTRKIFGGDPAGVENLDVNPEDRDFNEKTSLSPWGRRLIVSSPERAILELINELPLKESFDIVDKIFEGLTSLRPKRLDDLLKRCRSVKVRRLFFVFADRHHHHWRKYVEPSAYDLGSGPRALVKGGRIHPKYRIYVPGDYASSPQKSIVNDQ